MATVFLQKGQQNLVKQIVKEEFGQDLSTIMEVILENLPITTLNKIISSPKLNKYNAEQIKEFIMLLIKNGLIQTQVYQSDIKPEFNGQLLYTPQYTVIYGSLRHISYINHIKSIFGYEGKLITEYFTTHSCGTFEDCLNDITEEYSTIVSEQKVKQSFIQLVKNNYIVREVNQESQKSNTDELEGEDNESSPSKKKKSTKRKNNGGLEDEEIIEKKIQKESVDQQSMQQMLQINQLSLLAQNPNIQQALQQENIQLGSFFTGNNFFGQQNLQQKQPENIEERNKQDEYLIKDQKDNVFYNFYINHRKFLHDFRTKEICQVVEGKVGLVQKYIIQALLEKSQKTGKSAIFKKTERMTLPEILQILPSELKNIKEQEIKEGLDKLKLDGVKFIGVEYINAQTHYFVNVKKIVNNIKFRHIAKVIERKYDIETARIFRIMKQHTCLDENTVSELSLLTQDQVRRCLQTLTRDGFLKYESATEKDKHTPAIQLYMYNKEDIFTKIQEFYFKALYNLKVKLEEQYKKSQEIEQSLNKKERTKEWQHVLKMIKSLEIAVLELDSALLCFTEY